MACLRIDATLEETLKPATELSQYAWRFRYPGDPCEPNSGAARGPALASYCLGVSLPAQVMLCPGKADRGLSFIAPEKIPASGILLMLRET